MKDNTIFVSVASFRDSICFVTIQTMFKNARRPHNVFVGICQQNAAGDKDCLIEGLNDMPQFKHNVRIMRLSSDQARGPTYARFLCSTLYDDEEYFLQIDSHCKFVKDWDVLLIGMIKDLKASGVPKPVLSHYTPSLDSYTENPDARGSISTICKAWFTDQNLISLLGAGWVKPGKLPHPNSYIAAGMFFCEAKFLKEIPFDPELDFLFIGEELLHSARFYTHGWDIFTPNRNTIYHYYTRENEPKFWENKHNNADQASQKVRYILGIDTDVSKLTERQRHSLEKYGLGKARSLDSYYEFAGIDLKKKEVLKNMCDMNNESMEGVASDDGNFENKSASQTGKHSHSSTKWIITLLIVLSVMALVFFIACVIYYYYHNHYHHNTHAHYPRHQ